MKRSILLERLRDLFPGDDNTGLDAFDLLHKFGSPLTALLYSELFWPEFVEVNDMVFLGSRVEDADDRDRIAAAFSRFHGNRQQVEEAFNFVEVPSLFGKRADESSDAEDRLLAERIAAMWRARLADAYPDRIFDVTVVEPGCSDDEMGVRFRQRRR